MTRYFLTVANIEGFRGINNEGDPLEVKFRPDAINSIFAANGLGKSSLFEALTYAITGAVPKLDRMVAAESAKEYYANRFHSEQCAEIVLTFRPDDGGADVTIRIVRERTASALSQVLAAMRTQMICLLPWRMKLYCSTITRLQSFC